MAKGLFGDEFIEFDVDIGVRNEVVERFAAQRVVVVPEGGHSRDVGLVGFVLFGLRRIHLGDRNRATPEILHGDRIATVGDFARFAGYGALVALIVELFDERVDGVPVVDLVLLDLVVEHFGLGLGHAHAPFAHSPVEDRDRELQPDDLLIQQVGVGRAEVVAGLRKTEAGVDRGRCAPFGLRLRDRGFGIELPDLVVEELASALSSTVA